MLRTLCTLLIFCTAFAAQAQQAIDEAQLRVTYQLTYRKSTQSPATQQERMILLIGKQSSKFFSLNQHLRDSMAKQVTNPALLLGSMQDMPRSEFKYAIYKELNSDKLTYRDRVVIEKYEYTEPKNLFDWRITNEKKEIQGLSCQKATTTFRGRDYEAWFTMDIPISEGPYKFNGLPGLITEISDKEGDYRFNLIGVEKPKQSQPITVSDDYYEEVSREQYEKAVANSKNNFFGQLAQKGITIKTTPEQKKKFEEKNKAKNNPIER